MTIFPLPRAFDANEWFVLIILVITNVAVLFASRKLPISIIILVFLYSIAMARLADNALAGSQVDLYDIMDTGNYDLFDILTYFLYGPFAYFFLYLYRRWNVQGVYNVLYVSVWSIFGVAFERVTIHFHVFTFKEWNQLYSLVVYLIVQSLLIWFYHAFVDSEKEK